MAEVAKDLMNDMKNTGKRALDSGKDLYNDTRSQIPTSQMSQVADQITDTYQTLRKRADTALHASESYAKDHPFRTILGAAAVGFVAGMLIRNSRH